MKKYYKPIWQIYYVKIENTLAISSALTKPESSEDVSTIWEKGDDQEENYYWE